MRQLSCCFFCSGSGSDSDSDSGTNNSEKSKSSENKSGSEESETETSDDDKKGKGEYHENQKKFGHLKNCCNQPSLHEPNLEWDQILNHNIVFQ